MLFFILYLISVMTLRREEYSYSYHANYLTGYTNWWRLFLVRRGDYHVQIKKLHEKYGPVLRIGPNTLDLDIPELTKVLYSTDGKWRKVRDSLESRELVEISNARVRRTDRILSQQQHCDQCKR